MSKVKYLFDADSLIVACRRHYSPDFCLPFWQWILDGNTNATFYVIDKVCDELKRGNEDDYLRKFAEDNESALSLPTKADIQCAHKYGDVQQWAATVWSENKKKNKITKALEKFADEKMADPWLVAYAAVHGYSIVTNEEPAPESQTSVKLPDAARAFGVQTLKLHEVLFIHSGPNFAFQQQKP